MTICELSERILYNECIFIIPSQFKICVIENADASNICEDILTTKRYIAISKLLVYRNKSNIRCNNMVILHEVKLVPEAIAEGSNGRMALSPLVNVGRKHVLMARSIT